MGLKEDLASQVEKVFSTQWKEENTDDIPGPEDLRLNSNHAKNVSRIVVLYADIDGSTTMVDTQDWTFSAEIYKSYLRCASEIIRNEGGVITAYDGDRVMSVFSGKLKHTDAVRAAMKINFAVTNIIRPEIKKQYPEISFTLKHVIGIDSSQIRAARIGIHGDNDLVWIGRAANHAAKLCTLSDNPIWITKDVYDKMNESTKLSKGVDMWKKYTWKTMSNIEIYATTYHWNID